jgi:hypothetical protein
LEGLVREVEGEFRVEGLELRVGLWLRSLEVERGDF